MVERNRTAGLQGRGHTGSTGGFHPDHANLRGTLTQVGDDPRDAPATADRYHHHVGRTIQLIEYLRGDGALPRNRPHIVEGRHQGGAGTRGIGLGRRRSLVIAVPDRDQLHKPVAVVDDSLPLLLRGLAGDVHPAVHAHRLARQRESLSVVTGTGTHHAGSLLLIAELHQQIERTAHLVRADRLQVFTLQIHLGAGEGREPIGVLQRCGMDDLVDALGRGIDIGGRHHLGRAQETGVSTKTGI